MILNLLLIHQNSLNTIKKNMTLSMPDLSAYDTNPSAALNFGYGCQWVGMCFQNFDANMEFYSLFF